MRSTMTLFPLLEISSSLSFSKTFLLTLFIDQVWESLRKMIMNEVTTLDNSANVLKREISNWGEHALNVWEKRRDKARQAECIQFDSLTIIERCIAKQSKSQLCLMRFEHFALSQTSLSFLVCSFDLSSFLTDTIFILADYSWRHSYVQRSDNDEFQIISLDRRELKHHTCSIASHNSCLTHLLSLRLFHQSL